MKKMTLATMNRMTDYAAVRDFVRASGYEGVTVAQVRRHIRRGETATGQHLRALEAAGLIEKSHKGGGQSCKWGAPGIRQAWLERPLTTEQRRYRDYLLCRGQELPESLKRGSEPEVVQRIVSAANAPRIQTTAPASVWSLAA